MPTSIDPKPLSSYLQELVAKGMLPQVVADVINRLPDWKQQREAVKEWKDRLTDPAKEVVAEFESRSKGMDTPPDFFLDDTAIHIRAPFFYLCDDLETYVQRLQAMLERFLEETPCLICGKTLANFQLHKHCGFEPDDTPRNLATATPQCEKP